MSFIHRSGKAYVEWFPKTASTAFSVGVVLGFSGGALVVAASTETRPVGISMKPVASTDADYASTTMVPVLIPLPETLFEADVENSGSLAATNIGIQYDLNSTTGTGINLSGTSHKQFTVVGVISTTKALVRCTGAWLFSATA